MDFVTDVYLYQERTSRYMAAVSDDYGVAIYNHDSLVGRARYALKVGTFLLHIHGRHCIYGTDCQLNPRLRSGTHNASVWMDMIYWDYSRSWAEGTELTFCLDGP